MRLKITDDSAASEFATNYDGIDRLINQAVLEARIPLTEAQQVELIGTLGATTKALRMSKDLLDLAEARIALLQLREKQWIKVARSCMRTLYVVVAIGLIVSAAHILGLIP